MNTEKCFYSVLKNEDATPFVGDNLLIVADGLGGSGSTVHDVLPAEGATLHDEIIKAAFSDFDFEKSQDFVPYLDSLISPMSDGKPDTSALWASRIAIARCAYALTYDENFTDADLADGAVRERLAKYISCGLDGATNHFRLEKGKYDDQKILPTTLAFIRYSVDGSGVTTAEAVWAGDSRCYVLTKSGLRLLTVDDEDGSEAITNLFCVGGKKPAVLNYRKYEFNEPCVLIAVSDGLFDPFAPHGNLAVEKIILEHVAESNSCEELMHSLCEFYDGVKGDDATMAFAPVGFADYNDLREKLKDRTALISETWLRLCETNAALEIVNVPEEDVRRYVETRTGDKFDAIMKTIADNSEGGDIIYTPEIIKIIARTKLQIAENKKSEAEKNLELALNRLRSYMKEHCEKQPSDFFGTTVTADLPVNLANCVFCVIKSFNGIRRASDLQKKNKEIADEKLKWLEIIKERQNFYWRECERLENDNSQQERWEKAIRWLKTWLNIQVQFKKGFYVLQGVNKLEVSDKNIARQINEFVTANRTAWTATDGKIENAREEYFGAIDSLFEILLKNPSVCGKIFNDATLKKFALEETDKSDDGKSDGSAGISAVLHGQKEEIIKIIVNLLAEHYGETSVIDCYYNSTRLNAFRLYYKLKANPDDGIAKFEEELNNLEKEYGLLIAN